MKTLPAAIITLSFIAATAAATHFKAFDYITDAIDNIEIASASEEHILSTDDGVEFTVVIKNGVLTIK